MKRMNMKVHIFLTILWLVESSFGHGTPGSGSDKLKVFAISGGESDGLSRFLRSSKLFHYETKVIGKGSMRPLAKTSIMKAELETQCSSEKIAASTDTLFMFIEADDAILVGSPIEIIDSFHKLNAKIVFAADKHIWPDESLESEYPPVTEDLYPFLCSGAFIGTSAALCQLFSEVGETDDDQLFFTKLYLDTAMREKYNIKLDNRAHIFHSMSGASGDVSVKYLGSHSFVVNNRFQSTPKVVIANGAKVALNRLADYVPDGYSQAGGCQQCLEDRISLDGKEIPELPLVVLAVFIETQTPFLPTMLRRLIHIHYPFKRIVLTIHNSVPEHAPNVTEFLASSIIADFFETQVLLSEKHTAIGDVRNQVLDICVRVKCDYIFIVDSIAHIDNPKTLKILIEQNKPVIAPLLRRVGELWSNFWGSVSSSGYYSRSVDYMDIINRVKRGVWNVPCIGSAILIRADRMDDVRNSWFNSEFDPDVAFCAFMREKGQFMFVDNMHHFGHLVNPDNYNTSHYRPELWELNTNRMDWEELYIDREFWKVGNNVDDGTAVMPKSYQSPCNDVFMFPLFTETFCRHMIDEMEHYGKWSSGKNEDERLSGGYENVPTVDIHMRQIGYHQEWLQILKNYISPLAKFAFTGYEPQSRTSMAFVVRYHPNEQDRLRPHFDSSTFSAVVGLTRPGVDFQGGGTRFVRQNCSMESQPLGSVLLFPGRLTHWHEGLPVTKGVRYIIVTFIDP